MSATTAEERWLRQPAREIMPPMRRRGLLFVLCGLALGLAVLLGAAVGTVAIPPQTVAQMLVARLPFLHMAAQWPATFETILFEIRLPRVALMALSGAALAASGATYQGLFRNPLADPYLIGVAAGAGLGATLAITVGLPHTVWGLNVVPLAAYLGGLMTVTLVVLIARVGRTAPVTTLILAGVAVGSFAVSLTTALMLRSPDGMRRAFGWMLGGYSTVGWDPVQVMAPYVVVGLAVLQVYARLLNVLQLDEEQARQLGLNVERLKLTLVATATLVTATAVAFSGLIGFVGLIVPHIMRLIGGPDHRR
ncbi:MAG: iron ABC transporter permease, partial [Chloroflexi bacterium]|nr:iron ABC transporter permease [Chloroflexota bacterium]